MKILATNLIYTLMGIGAWALFIYALFMAVVTYGI